MAPPREAKNLAIGTYFHCKRCFEVLPNGMSMRDFSRFAVGFTPQGLQVWCTRHDANIIHIDFAGQKFGPVLGEAILPDRPQQE